MLAFPLNRQAHFGAHNIVLLLQKPLAQKTLSPRGKEDQVKHKNIKRDNITNKEEITAVH